MLCSKIRIGIRGIPRNVGIKGKPREITCSLKGDKTIKSVQESDDFSKK